MAGGHTLAQLKRDPFYIDHGLGNLQEIGVIDSQRRRPTSEEAFKPRSEHAKDTSIPIIHPILQRDRWLLDDLQDPEKVWESLDEVVRLATCYLAEPCMLPFFGGMLDKDNWWVLKDPRAEKKFKQKLYSFDHKDWNTEVDFKKQMVGTWKRIAAMEKSMTWRFSDLLVKDYALTTPIDGLPGLGDNGKTKGSLISLNMNYLNMLLGHSKVAHYPQASEFDQDSALLRCKMHLAVTMCHEVCHALGYATFGRKAHEWTSGGNKPLPAEPFYRDDRITELGWAFAQYAFDGLWFPIGNISPANAVFPYGLFAVRFPDNVDMPDRPSHIHERRPRSEKIRRLALRMNYVEKMFTKTFWEKSALQSPAEFHPSAEEKGPFVVQAQTP